MKWIWTSQLLLEEELVLVQKWGGGSFEDGVGKLRPLLLEDLEFTLDLVPGLVHLGGDHREVASVELEQADEAVDLILAPVRRRRLLGRILHDLLLLLPNLVLEGYLVNKGPEGGNRALAGIFMTVVLLNSHVKGTTGSDRVEGERVK